MPQEPKREERKNEYKQQDEPLSQNKKRAIHCMRRQAKKQRRRRLRAQEAAKKKQETDAKNAEEKAKRDKECSRKDKDQQAKPMVEDKSLTECDSDLKDVAYSWLAEIIFSCCSATLLLHLCTMKRTRTSGIMI